MKGIDIAVLVMWFAVVGVMVSSWVTHVVVCIQASQWGFLIAGAIAAPVAWVHGIGIWFGAW